MDESFDYVRGIVPATETMFLVPSSSGTPNNAITLNDGTTIVTLNDGTTIVTLNP